MTQMAPPDEHKQQALAIVGSLLFLLLLALFTVVVVRAVRLAREDTAHGNVPTHTEHPPLPAAQAATPSA
ncbi:MAG TPA: hypothetical protein GX714_14265, partial [Chloroflexi bacterium]|nr:hypothetical protein [Chloroflexota bacterium]